MYIYKMIIADLFADKGDKDKGTKGSGNAGAAL
jgi:hypothetical protein